VNPLDYILNIEALKNVVLFNRSVAKDVELNNKLFRSIVVNGKGYQEFVEKSKSLFVV
jgi:ribonucleotide reductase alpha subunit